MGGIRMLSGNTRDIQLEYIEDIGNKLGMILQTKDDYVELIVNKPEESLCDFNADIDFLQSCIFMTCGYEEYSSDVEETSDGKKVSTTCYKMGAVPGRFFSIRREESKARIQLVDIEDIVEKLSMEQIKRYEKAGDPFGLRTSKRYCQMADKLK